MQKKVLTIAIIAVLCMTLLGSSFLFAQKLRKEGRYYIADITKEYNVKKGGNLIMKDIRGDVEITTWNKNSVKIYEIRKMDVYTKAEAKAVLKELKSSYKQSGNTIKVGAEGEFRSYMTSKFKITLPSEFNVKVNTKGGDLSVTDLKGTVELKTSGGDIDLIRIDGVVEAKTSGGDIVVKKSTQVVTVRTSGGDIDLIDVEGEVTAKTSGGGINIRNNKAKVTANTSGGSIKLSNIGAEVDAHTSGGNIVVNGTKGELKVRTSGGDIELDNIGGVVEAKTSGGDVEARNVVKGIKAKTSGGDVELVDIKGFIEGATSGAASPIKRQPISLG